MRIKTEPHPLENITLQAFAEREHHDSSSLGYFLDNTTALGGFFPDGRRRRRSSRKVCAKLANAVLETMKWQGKLYQDKYGWHYRTETRPAIFFSGPLYQRPPQGTPKPKPNKCT